MINVAINATSVAPGGGLTVLAGLLEGWQEIGWPAKLTVYASRPKVLSTCQQISPDITAIPFALNAPSYRHFLFQKISLGRLIEKTGADAVYSNQTAVGHCSVPQLVHHQNLKRFQQQSYLPRLRNLAFTEGIKDFSARQAIKQSACNVFISRYLMEQANTIVPGFENKNYVVYNGVSPRLLQRTPEDISWDGCPRIFALQGTAKHKDNGTLMRMMAELVKLDPQTPWKLLVAGSGDWEPYKAQCTTLGILDRVEFLGFLHPDQFDLLLRNACCLVFTSILEGFGLPIIEAMARGCPTVACNCTALPEVVGDAGILVPPGDAAAFAKAVFNLYHEHPIRHGLVTEGYQHIKQFSWTQAAKLMAEHLESIVGSGGNSSLLKRMAGNHFGGLGAHHFLSGLAKCAWVLRP